MSEPFYRLHISIPFDDVERMEWTMRQVVDALKDTPTWGVAVWVEQPEQPMGDDNGTTG